MSEKINKLPIQNEQPIPATGTPIGLEDLRQSVQGRDPGSFVRTPDDAPASENFKRAAEGAAIAVAGALVVAPMLKREPRINDPLSPTIGPAALSYGALRAHDEFKAGRAKRKAAKNQ